MESKEPPDIVSVDTTVRDGNGNIEDKENCPVITFNDDVAENVEHEDAETKDVESTQVVTTEIIKMEYLEAESKENNIENLDRIDTEIVSSDRTENEINCDSNTYVLESREESQTGNENIESINQINEDTCIVKSSEKFKEIEENIKKTDIDIRHIDFCKEETKDTDSCPNVVEFICETKKTITPESEHTESVNQNMEEKIDKSEEKGEEIEVSSSIENCGALMQENKVSVNEILSDISLEKIETEEAESFLSATPDIVKVCDIQVEAFEDENSRCQQVNNELQQVDEAITDADRESPIHQLHTSQLQAEVLTEPNGEASTEPINGTKSKEMIVDLIPEPVINICKDSGNESKTRKPSSVSTGQEKLKRGQTKQLQEKKAVNGNNNKKSDQIINLNTNRHNEQKTSKNTTRKDSSMSTTITGHEKVIINGLEGKDTEIAKTLYGLNGDTELIPKNLTSKPKNLVNSEKQETKKSKNSSQKISSVSSSASATVTETQSDQNSNEVSSTSLIQSEHMCETSTISSSVISGVEEKSISATEVIEMFESESKAFITSETNSSSCFQQDSVTYAENVTKEHQKEDLTSKEKCSAQGLPSLKTEKIMKDSEIVEKVKKSKSSTKSVYAKSNNGSSTPAVKSNRSHSRVGDKSTRNGTHTGNTEETNKKPTITLVTDEQSEKMATKSDKSDMKSSRSRSQRTHSSVSTNKSATFVKDSTVEQTIGTTTTNSSSKTRTTMIVRLYPGQSKRISAYLDQQPGDQSAIPPHSVAGDVQYEDTPGSICGLEISFTSVPQDIDVKLIHEGNTA